MELLVIEDKMLLNAKGPIARCQEKKKSKITPWSHNLDGANLFNKKKMSNNIWRWGTVSPSEKLGEGEKLDIT